MTDSTLEDHRKFIVYTILSYNISTHNFSFPHLLAEGHSEGNSRACKAKFSEYSRVDSLRWETYSLVFSRSYFGLLFHVVVSAEW